MAGTVKLSLGEARELAEAALRASGCSRVSAVATARALVAAEADGQAGHGLVRIPYYAAQVSTGKVLGDAAIFEEQVAPGVVRVDAGNGFAYPALDAAIESLAPLARRQGIAAAAIHRSHHCGQAGAHVERLAEAGLVALMFANTPPAMAFWGATTPALGTNPIAFAAPRQSAAPLVIDMALSQVARGKVVAASASGRPIPEGWALDAEGRPTTDADAALAGSLLPMGGAKGAALALMVEVFAAALTGARFGFEATSFFEAQGEPPGVGQLLLALDPGPLSGGRYAERVGMLTDMLETSDGARLPGASRLARRRQAAGEGLSVDPLLHADLLKLAGADTRPAEGSTSA
ncbi:MAG TPA: Ldh family oxidoreductase [Woeseiaceae bacterium]|nr:Ldh family oxidoreductase [Woeseiaceae bacterium]